MICKIALKNTLNGFKKNIPIIIGVVLLVSLINTLIPKNLYTKIFTGNIFLDPLLGSVFGSIAAGNPVNSYIIGSELLSNDVSLLAITAFIVAWVTVGIVTLPAEMYMLGKKFAIVRNLISFIISIIIAVLVVMILNIL